MRKRYFPFHPLGFRCNPFRTLTEEEWMGVAVLPDEIIDILQKDVGHLQILGGPGRGKTSTLLGLAAYYSNQARLHVYEYLPPGQRKFKTELNGLDVFLLDEFQRLNKSHRRRLLSKATRVPGDGLQLVVSSHIDFRSQFEAFKLPVTTLQLEKMTCTHFEEIIRRRLTFFSLDKTAGPMLKDEAIQYLWEKYGNDFRASEQVLYQVFQRRKQRGKITIDHLRELECSSTNDGERE